MVRTSKRHYSEICKRQLSGVIIGQLYILIALFLLLGFNIRNSLAQISTQVIDLPTVNWNVPLKEINYQIGLGDLNGDGSTDFVILAWWDKNDGNNDITQKIYAYLADGTYLWTLDTQINKGSDHFSDPVTTVSLNVWDLDGDGKCEVITQIRKDLVIVDGMTGLVINSVGLHNPRSFIYSTIAFLTGNDPDIVVAYGQIPQIDAYDKNLNQLWQFSDTTFSNEYGNRLTTWDLDDDGKDEIVSGPMVLNTDGTLRTCMINRYTERSFIHDFDPQNPGYEQFLFVGDLDYGSEQWIGPFEWKGAYLYNSVDSTIIWHEGGDSVAQTGWGRPHRGWIAEYDTSYNGLEIYVSGIYWQDDEYQRYLNGEYNDGRRPWGGLKERDFIYSAKGELIDRPAHFVGYPVQWDHDPQAEIFLYRSGRLVENFKDPPIADGLAKAYGSGEAVCADIRGDHREEIILGSYDKLYIYTNSDDAKPSIPSPRLGHQYRLNLSRTASGFWKPQPIDPRFNRPDSIVVLAPNGGEQLQAGSLDTVRWTTTGMVAAVRLSYSTDGGSSWISITDSTVNSGRYYWEVPQMPSVDAYVRVANFYNSALFDLSDAPFIIFSDSLVLPVQLSSFSAEKMAANTIYLKWRTESEKNNVGFDIERSFQESNFQTIAFIKGKGTTVQPHDYQLTDTVDKAGIYRYRLKQIDNLGKFSFSEEVQIEVNLPKCIQLLPNYPNPFNSSTTLKFYLPREAKVSISVFNTAGKMIEKLVEQNFTQGEHHIVWDGKDINGFAVASGAYFLQFRLTNERRVQKVLFLK